MNFSAEKLISLALSRSDYMSDHTRSVMGDDYRENEAAKLATAEQELWRMRKYYLKLEIIEIRRKLHSIAMIDR